MKVAKFDPNYPQNLGNTTYSQGGGTPSDQGNTTSGGAPTGAAGGDLAGSYPDPDVVGIHGTPVDALPADATKYLDGTGHFTTPVGASGSYVLSSHGGEEVYQTIGALGAAYTLDLANGNAFDATLTADCTLAFAGATAGTLCTFELFLRQDGTGGWVTTWPGSVIWPGGTAPTLSTTPSTVTLLGFATLDGGTTWYGVPTGEGAALGTAIPLIESGTGATGTAPAASHEDHVHPAGGGGGSLEVKEVDGAPDVTGVTQIIVPNGSLTDNTGGSVTLTHFGNVKAVAGNVGGPLSAGVAVFAIELPWAGTFTNWTLIAEQTGSITVGIWKTTLGAYPPTSADSIVNTGAGGVRPYLSGDIERTSSSLANWTATFSAGDVLRVNLDAADGVVKFFELTLAYTRN